MCHLSYLQNLAGEGVCWPVSVVDEKLILDNVYKLFGKFIWYEDVISIVELYLNLWMAATCFSLLFFLVVIIFSRQEVQ